MKSKMSKFLSRLLIASILLAMMAGIWWIKESDGNSGFKMMATFTPVASKVMATSTPTASKLPVIELPATPTQKVMAIVIAARALNIRACGNLDCHILDVLDAGEEISIDFCDGDWAYMGRGWVKASYISPNPCK